MTVLAEHLNQLDDISVPGDLDAAAYKAELFLIRGMNHRALAYWSELVDKLRCPENLSQEDFYGKVHFRVCRMAFHHANLSMMESILESVDESLHEHATYQLFKHLHWHCNQANLGMCFFPLNVWYTDNGPHLPFEGEHESWGAGRIDSISEGEIQARMVEYKNGRQIKAGLVAIPVGVLSAWHSDKTIDELEEGDYFELYEIEDEDYPTLRWWGRSWDGWEDLPPLQTDPHRYLRKSGWIKDGDTFIEKAVRGESALDDLESEIAEWREGKCEKSKKWTLADHLGLLPEEFNRWVELGSQAYIEQVISERRKLWEENRNRNEQEPILYL